ncbi:uncharacterized protein LOC122655128 [Telopea speciosissima]|uniref:uncharacterized protein LOC122655128 n=1 Tax=Telopea speciosissima TaxID=54955 RepID=UPI001CC5751A|nr:uncharacterized protein LOC122655128 [Telopea speciosissima]
MKNLDVILGMDWLSTYRATISCYDKEIIFRPEKGMKFKISGLKRGNATVPITSAVPARKLLSQGCQGFLAAVVEEKKEIKIEDIDVVRDFPDVFPTNLMGVPPNMEVEFTIDLIPGTTPISKAPYRMAPAELNELKEQL